MSGFSPRRASVCIQDLAGKAGVLPPGTPHRDVRGLPVRSSVTPQEKIVVEHKEKGTVKWFNAAKGYGFIQRSTGEDVFVHHSSIQMNGYRTLNNGTPVEFEVKEGPKGLHAENVNPN